MGESLARAGRPRDRRLDERLLQAAYEVFLERGYQRASLSEIARRAGVGTPAIYRRWRRKVDVAIDIVERQASPDPIPDSGSIRDDLVALLRQRLRIFSTRLFHDVLLPVTLEAANDARLADRVRSRFVAYREPSMEARIRKSIDLGELRSDTEPSRLIDLLMGTVTLPLLFSQDLPHASEAPGIVDFLLDGFAAKGR